LTTEAAGRLLRLERRQVFRLLKAYRTEGPTGLISKRRGRPGNRRKPEALRRTALAIIRKWYWDFGPTLAAEKLRGSWNNARSRNAAAVGRQHGIASDGGTSANECSPMAEVSRLDEKSGGATHY
jgi:hypothetical protein